MDYYEPLDIVRAKCITLSKLAYLARWNGATAATTSDTSQITVEDFRNYVISVLYAELDRSNQKSYYHRMEP